MSKRASCGSERRRVDCRHPDACLVDLEQIGD